MQQPPAYVYEVTIKQCSAIDVRLEEIYDELVDLQLHAIKSQTNVDHEIMLDIYDELKEIISKLQKSQIGPGTMVRLQGVLNQINAIENLNFANFPYIHV